MRAEYKRDMSHNYLILQGDEEVDTSSYQVRMLIGNGVPSLLKCRLQGLDGKTLFYYEITSKQALSSLFEQKKLQTEDLRLIFGGFVRVMEEMSEYLLNPGRIVLRPEYIFVDPEKRELFFCYLPGFEREVGEQFQALTEYILPKLDHEDSQAVMLGYGVYRRALEDCFHLEYIKEELYQIREEPVDKKVSLKDNGGQHLPESMQKVENSDGTLWELDGEDLLFSDAEKKSDNGRKERKVKTNSEKSETMQKQNVKMRNRILGCVSGALLILAILAANLLGYLPWLKAEIAIGGILIFLGAGLLIWYLAGKKKKTEPEEEEWKRKVRQETRDKEDAVLYGTGAERGSDAEYSEPERPDKIENLRQKEQAVLKNSRKAEDMEEGGGLSEPLGQTVVLSANVQSGPASLVSREPGELATIYLTEELTVIGKLHTAADAVIPLPTVSRLHAKVRRRGEEYFLTDMNSRNGTSVNGKMLKGDEEYLLENEDEVDFAQARYIFLK
ncbi:MAG: DUF6382 domain-containing protein [Eubacteriales bacterium]|nr:DUF6382 domain-containing protein [Eubacteriales bacterium]